MQKSQISYYNRHLYACVSFLKVKKKAELPEDYFVLTLGLSAPLESDRVAAKTEPYPGRWTTHFVISSPSALDEELFDWIEQAYCMELFGENVQIAAASHDLFAKRVNGQIYRPLVEKYIAGEKRL